MIGLRPFSFAGSLDPALHPAQLDAKRHNVCQANQFQRGLHLALIQTFNVVPTAKYDATILLSLGRFSPFFETREKVHQSSRLNVVSSTGVMQAPQLLAQTSAGCLVNFGSVDPPFPS